MSNIVGRLAEDWLLSLNMAGIAGFIAVHYFNLSSLLSHQGFAVYL